MAWRAVHPALTEERRVPAEDPEAPTFTIGFWPPLEAEKAKLYVSKLRHPKKAVEADETAEQLLRQSGIDLAAFWAMVRHGVRGWEGLGDIPCKTEVVRIDGRDHTALSDESLQVVYHNGLLVALALECWKFNNLTEEEKKTSNSLLSSSISTSPTPATSVMTSSSPATPGAASYVSTDA